MQSPRSCSLRDEAGIARARELIDAARHVVVLSGAGISTESGIPDFRGPKGVWTRNPAAERRSTFDDYMNDIDVRRDAWQDRLSSPAWTARPNAGHIALVELERRGILELLVTQNIDGLHQAAGSNPDLVIELHGTIHDCVCMACGHRQPMKQVLERVRAEEDDPRCHEMLAHGSVCGGILKSATISFGQNLVEEDLRRAQQAVQSCDLMLVVGSSLAVYPAAGLVPDAYAAGASIIIVNGEPTPFDPLADVVLNGRIGALLPAIITKTS